MYEDKSEYKLLISKPANGNWQVKQVLSTKYDSKGVKRPELKLIGRIVPIYENLELAEMKKLVSQLKQGDKLVYKWIPCLEWQSSFPNAKLSELFVNLEEHQIKQIKDKILELSEVFWEKTITNFVYQTAVINAAKNISFDSPIYKKNNIKSFDDLINKTLSTFYYENESIIKGAFLLFNYAQKEKVHQQEIAESKNQCDLFNNDNNETAL